MRSQHGRSYWFATALAVQAIRPAKVRESRKYHWEYIVSSFFFKELTRWPCNFTDVNIVTLCICKVLSIVRVALISRNLLVFKSYRRIVILASVRGRRSIRKLTSLMRITALRKRLQVSIKEEMWTSQLQSRVAVLVTLEFTILI